MSSVYLSVVIPIYNEKSGLKLLFDRLKSALAKIGKSYEVIFIDDGSTDGSAEILSNLVGTDRNYKLIIFRKNFGQTAAIAAGVNFAQGEVVVPMDADLENNPDDISSLLKKLDEGYDIVSGWRVNRWPNKIITRRLTSNVANWLISKVSGIKLHDYGCTLKAYRRDIIKGINLYGEMHRFIPALAAWQGAKVTELEVSYEPRQFGASKYGLNRVFKVLLDLITLKFLNDYSVKPIYFFGRFGFWSIFLGFLTFVVATYYKLTGQKDYIQTPLPAIMVLFMVVGVLLILIGLLAEMIMRSYHETAKRPVYYIKGKFNIE